MLELRPYQREAIDALNKHLSSRPDNPCVVLPTGSGKSLVMASAINEWRQAYPPFRVIVLAHRKELVEQNSQEFIGCAEGVEVGIYSASLGSKELEKAITFAAIDSVYDKASAFPSFDAIVVDEAHRIPVKGEGKYRRFINDCKAVNPNLRVIGFTATPFRLGSGPICHKDFILNKICYEANVGELINQKYLCALRSKVSDHAPDLSKVKKQSGDYQQKSLGEIVRSSGLIPRTIKDALSHLDNESRKCCVWFCVDVEHCLQVLEELKSYGEEAVAVTGNTSIEERDSYVEMFRNGEVRHILNVNVFTEGFNVKQVDAIILLRPTLSKGMYLQMVGRGLRLHSSKTDCLILDYAHCIENHGPIDMADKDEVKLEICQECRECFPRTLKQCPRCGWEMPKEQREARERKEQERKMHEARVAQLAILGSQPHEYPVSAVMVGKHEKNGFASLCVTYRCGIQTFREWVCFDHEGFPRQKAEMWWNKRFSTKVPLNTAEALQDIFLNVNIKSVTKTITVVKNGKYNEIINHKIEREQQ